MNEEKNRYFTVTDQSGNTREYEILFTFDSDELKKSYIVFTDNSLDEEGNVVTYAAVYDKNGETLKLNDIETEEEWNIIENLLSSIEEASE